MNNMLIWCRILIQTTNTCLMSKISNYCHKIVVKAVSNKGMTSVPHCWSNCQSWETPFQGFYLLSIYRPVWVITDPCGLMIKGNVRSIVTWFKDQHVLFTECSSGILKVVSSNTSRIWLLSSALSPEVCMVLIITLSAIALEIRYHAFPSIILSCQKNVIIILVEAISQILIVCSIVLGSLPIKVNLHIVQRLFELACFNSQAI